MIPNFQNINCISCFIQKYDSTGQGGPCSCSLCVWCWL